MNAKTLRRAVVAILAIYLVAMVGLGARAQGPDKWSRFNATRTSSQVVRIVVKTRCLNAEDSAAHLREIDYGSGRLVLGCSRKGF